MPAADHGGIRYADCDGLKLAYQISGDGPRDLVMVTEWSTPLEARWEVPAIAGRLRRLGSFARVISFDKRGIGLSDRSELADTSTPELWVRDLVAVLDAAQSDRPIVLGAHEGGQIAMLYAASLPDRTAALILANTGARLTSTDDYPIGPTPDEWRPDIDGMVAIWQDGTGGEVHIGATRTDPWWRDWYARSRRQQASPSTALALMRMFGELDVRSVLGAIRAPTLVIHRSDNEWWPPEHGKYLAANIEGARFVELPGGDNYWWAGDADPLVDEVEQFVLGDRQSTSSERELMTLVFTDIVQSTEQLTAMGDRRWAGLLDAHDELTRLQIERHGGRLVKRLGDGLLATFEGPARAVQAARDMRSAVAQIGVEIRAAVHTGEVERRGDDLGGVAVHLTARLLELAAPSDIVVSDTVRGLVAGSGLEFESLGSHRLRGIPDTWTVHRVID